jgi:hypothetical protein
MSKSRSFSLFSTTLEKPATAPERVQPDAGYLPDWEDRPGLPQEEFLKSDMSKPDIAGMFECPLTRWNSEGWVNQDPVTSVFPIATNTCIVHL